MFICAPRSQWQGLPGQIQVLGLQDSSRITSFSASFCSGSGLADEMPLGKKDVVGEKSGLSRMVTTSTVNDSLWKQDQEGLKEQVLGKSLQTFYAS